MRLSCHAPAHHGNHGQAVTNLQAVWVDGGLHVRKELLPVRLQELGLSHQGDMLPCCGQVLKGYPVSLQAGQDFFDNSPPRC